MPIGYGCASPVTLLNSALGNLLTNRQNTPPTAIAKAPAREPNPTAVPIDTEFGVPDFTNLAGSFAVGQTTQIIENMTRMIARYEPRLKSPRIQVVEGAQEVLSLSFSLEGLVAIDNRDIPIHLATRVSSDGHVSLAMQ